MMILLLETQSAISTSVCSGLVQVDVDFRMTQRTTTTVTGHNSLVRESNRRLINQLNCPVLVHLASKVGKSGIAVVVLLVHLKNQNNRMRCWPQLMFCVIGENQFFQFAFTHLTRVGFLGQIILSQSTDHLR